MIASAFIHPSAWKWNSRKFGVASNPVTVAPSIPQRYGVGSSAPKRVDQVGSVAPLCSKWLRLVTAQLPEKSCT
jgi:hypothetical protein